MPISSILVALGKIPDAELAALTVSRAVRAAEVPAGLRFSLSRRRAGRLRRGAGG